MTDFVTNAVMPLTSAQFADYTMVIIRERGHMKIVTEVTTHCVAVR